MEETLASLFVTGITAGLVAHVIGYRLGYRNASPTVVTQSDTDGTINVYSADQHSLNTFVRRADGSYVRRDILEAEVKAKFPNATERELRELGDRLDRKNQWAGE